MQRWTCLFHVSVPGLHGRLMIEPRAICAIKTPFARMNICLPHLSEASCWTSQGELQGVLTTKRRAKKQKQNSMSHQHTHTHTHSFNYERCCDILLHLLLFLCICSSISSMVSQTVSLYMDEACPPTSTMETCPCQSLVYICISHCKH